MLNLKGLSIRLVVCGFAVAAIPAGAASYASGMITADICRAYATGSIVEAGGDLPGHCR